MGERMSTTSRAFHARHLARAADARRAAYWRSLPHERRALVTIARDALLAAAGERSYWGPGRFPVTYRLPG